MTRGEGRSFMTVQVSWRERASCLGQDLNVFFSENIVDQSYAITFCNRCPVKIQCFNSSDAEDFKYSVRAGYFIDTYKGGPKRPPSYYKPSLFLTSEQLAQRKENRRAQRSAKSERERSKDWSHKLGTECKNGHIFTEETIDAYGRCRTCCSDRVRSRRGKLCR